MKFWYFRQTSFFSGGNALFQTHNWEKSSFFNTLIRVIAQIYANTWQGGHNVPHPGPNRVKSTKVQKMFSICGLTTITSATEGTRELMTIIHIVRSEGNKPFAQHGAGGWDHPQQGTRLPHDQPAEKWWSENWGTFQNFLGYSQQQWYFENWKIFLIIFRNLFGCSLTMGTSPRP